MSDVDEGVGCVAIADMQFFNTEPQPVRIEADFRHADGAVETGGKAASHDVLRDQRHADKAHEAENEEHDDDGFEGPPKPSRSAEAEPAKSLGPGALRASPWFVDHGCGTMSLGPASIEFRRDLAGCSAATPHFIAL